MAAPLSSKLEWELANPLWANALNPVINSPILQGQNLTVTLFANTPMTINHNLGRMQRGVFITPFGNAIIWVAAPFNPLTITVESSVDVKVMLWNY